MSKRRVPILLCALTALAGVSTGSAQDLERGKRLYDRWCAECHGLDGRGDGSAAPYMLPRPRDFTPGVYQIRTTASGELPTDADVARAIKEGMPGTAMPGWATKFHEAEIADLVAYVKSFSHFFEQLGEPTPLEFSRPPRATEEGLAEGRRFYEEIECFKCHGDAGRGDGPSAPTLQDDLDFPIRAADLTENWNFNGGGAVEDIYRSLRTGLDGTPMPSFSDLIDSGFMTDEQLWRVAQYVRSLAPEEPPRVREVITAARLEGPLPASPDDSLWFGIEAFYVPLVGQVIEEPRWFSPTVDGMWVQAAHNDDELTLRLAWHDPSRSPDPDWIEWQQWVAQSMFPLQDSSGVVPRPDMVAVQFPAAAPAGRERPYFLMGDPRRPVYLWRWVSEPDSAVEARATGLATMQPVAAGEQRLGHASVWDRGEWRVQFRRSLASPDSTRLLGFHPGDAIPIALFAWDGSSGERGSQMAVSSWYSLYLEPPTSATVYVSPVVAMLLTALLGVLVVWRAQKREDAGEAS